MGWSKILKKPGATRLIILIDNPCAGRQITGQSVVCVCNATYCDDIIREIPINGSYVAYTSSQSGDRFKKTSGEFQTDLPTKASVTLELDPETKYQTIEGFGGAVTDAAAINWLNMSNVLQEFIINSYFSETGLEYNMIRTPIGGSDFSTHPYAYNELPENDTKLTNFSLTVEDYQYKIPMIKACMNVSTAPVHIVATTWSPPNWMKTNDDVTGFSRLKHEYYQTYADYHYKYLDKYAAEDITVWAITTTNEPLNGVVPIIRFNSLGWCASCMGEWIINNLGPTIRNSTFKNLKILTVDDQRYTIPLWFNVMVKEHPKVLDYIDGVAVHFYGDGLTPASVLDLVTKTHPDKFILGTEACEGGFPWQKEKVLLGSWQRAKNYITDMISDLNYNVVGWIDWNMCLNSQGGPNWDKNFVDSPIIVFPEKDEFVKQPMFYAMGHFSKFVPRGSKRIDVTEKKSIFTSSVDNVAFVTPHNTVVVVLYNSKSARTVSLKIGGKQAAIKMDSNSVTTVEFPYET